MDMKTLASELHNTSILERPKYEDIETLYCLWQANGKRQSTSSATCGSGDVAQGTLAAEIAAARKKIQDALKEPNSAQTTSSSSDLSAVVKRVDVLEKENKDMRHEIKELKHLVEKLQSTIENLNKSSKTETSSVKPVASAPKKKEAEDEIDLFGSDEEEESEEQVKRREELLKAYEEKKSKKPGPIAKSSVVLEVKPWDDETDMKETERLVRTIEMDGLVWGASKLVPVGYGIQKLQIMCIVEDDKVSVEELQEKIQENEDYVQSVDIAAFNKI